MKEINLKKFDHTGVVFFCFVFFIEKDETEPKIVQATQLQQEEPKRNENSGEQSTDAKSRSELDETELKTALEIDTISSREGTCSGELDIETGISLSSSILNSETHVTPADIEAGLTEPVESAHVQETDNGPQTPVGTSELTTGMVAKIEAELDATVERSRLRMETDLTISEKDEKDADEGVVLIYEPVMRKLTKEFITKWA